MTILKQPGREIGADEKLISSGLIDSFSLMDLALLCGGYLWRPYRGY
jgi:hypothetical protein